MANDSINEMISAFALGCMDKKNYKQFKNYVRGGGELPSGELGDSQNIISLIPTILDIDSPREELKNELGTRLIEIQKNINNRVIENRRKTRIDVEENFLERSSTTKVFDVDQKREDFSRKTRMEKIDPIPPTQIKEVGTKSYNTTQQIEEMPKSHSLSIIILWGFSSILLIAIVVLSYLFFDKTNSLAEDNSKLHSKIIKLRTDLSKTNDFVNKNKEFVDFFNNPNISIVQLKGMENISKESGRLLISFDAGEGLLQLHNMPRINSDKVYQLWLVSTGGTFSLGPFEITPDKKYIKFSEIPFVMKEDIQLFRISQEVRGETEMPSGKTILFGSFQKSKTSTKRR